MTDLKAGMQIMHNCKAIELIAKTDSMAEFGDMWRCKMLFVDEPNRTILIEPGDRISFLHTTPIRS